MFTPSIGISCSRYSLAEFNNVPSPPKTIIRSTLLTKSLYFKEQTFSFLYSEDSSIYKLTLLHESDVIKVSRVLSSTS